MSDGIAAPDTQEISPVQEKGANRFNEFVNFFKETSPIKLAKQFDFQARLGELVYDPKNADRLMKLVGAGILTASILGISNDPNLFNLNKMPGINEAMISSSNMARLAGEVGSPAMARVGIGMEVVDQFLQAPVLQQLTEGIRLVPDTFLPKMKEVVDARKGILLRSMSKFNDDKANIQQAMATFS